MSLKNPLSPELVFAFLSGEKHSLPLWKAMRDEIQQLFALLDLARKGLDLESRARAAELQGKIDNIFKLFAELVAGADLRASRTKKNLKPREPSPKREQIDDVLCKLYDDALKTIEAEGRIGKRQRAKKAREAACKRFNETGPRGKFKYLATDEKMRNAL
jgi:hypothetical protein